MGQALPGWLTVASLLEDDRLDGLEKEESIRLITDSLVLAAFVTFGRVGLLDTFEVTVSTSLAPSPCPHILGAKSKASSVDMTQPC